MVLRCSSNWTARLNSARATRLKCFGYFGRPPANCEGLSGVPCGTVPCSKCWRIVFAGRIWSFQKAAPGFQLSCLSHEGSRTQFSSRQPKEEVAGTNKNFFLESFVLTHPPLPRHRCTAPT